MYDDNTYDFSPKDESGNINQTAYFAYLEEISKYKLLSTDEEILLFQKIQNGDYVAKELFIKANLRLVVKVAKSYYVPGRNELLDLIQDGNIGLLKAVESFDPSRGCKFSTFAVYHINKAIQRSSCRTGLPLELPQQKISLINKIRFAFERLEVETGSKPSLKEIADHLHVSVEQIRLLLPYLSQSISLYSKIKEDVDEREIIDVFDEHYADEDDIERKCIINETRSELQRIILEVLGEKEAYILLSRWGISGQPVKDVPTLAQELEMSYQGIRQSESRSIAKLKRYLLSMDKSLLDFI